MNFGLLLRGVSSISQSQRGGLTVPLAEHTEIISAKTFNLQEFCNPLQKVLKKQKLVKSNAKTLTNYCKRFIDIIRTIAYNTGKI